MKIVLAACISLSSVFAFARDTQVHGYYRNNGTYVQPHHRTTPNDTKLDNYSTQGNTNPYTGKHGTVDPYGR